MFIGSLVTVTGCIPQCLTTDLFLFLSARMLSGAGVGVITYTLPMFVSEIAPAELRGVLGCFMQLMMVLGTVFAAALNCQTWFGYQWSFLMPAVPAAIVAAGIFSFPQSPRFALVYGKRNQHVDGGEEQAWKALRYLRGSDEAADEELSLIKESLAEEELDGSWSLLLEKPSLRRRVVIANLLQWMQQLTGVNAVLSYGPSIFQSAGVPLSALTCAVVTNVFNLVGTVLMMTVIDRLGRRLLLLLGAGAMFVCTLAAAVCAYLLETGQATEEWRFSLGLSLLLCVCLYMLSFAFAWGGVPWVYPSEIFPMNVKEKAMSTSVCSQWSANFLVAYIVPQQVQSMRVYGTFAFYACCLLCSGILVFWMVPETKGIELEQMDALFGDDQDLLTPLLPKLETRDGLGTLPHVESHACCLEGLATQSAPMLMGLTQSGNSSYVNLAVRAQTSNELAQGLSNRPRANSDAKYDRALRWRATARVYMSRTGAVTLL